MAECDIWTYVKAYIFNVILKQEDDWMTEAT